MAEAHQARMQNAVEEMVQSLERDHIRKMQVSIPLLFSYCMRCSTSSDLSSFAAGSHVQLQRRLLQSPLRLHVPGASVHREVSHSSGSSSGAGHLRPGEVSGEGRFFFFFFIIRFSVMSRVPCEILSLCVTPWCSSKGPLVVFNNI